MMRTAFLALVLVAACSKKEPAQQAAGSGSGSVVAVGSGSMAPPVPVPVPVPVIDAAGAAVGPEIDANAAAAMDPDAGPAGDSGSVAGAGSGVDQGSAAGSGSGAAPPAVEFDELTKDEQMKFMRTQVMPPMKAAFAKFDPKAFGKFNCKTCHGKGAITKEFDMPNPDLPPLDFAELKAGKHAAIATFMKDVVTPQMAAILGEEVHSPTNPKGFGCLECHTEKK